MVTGENRYSGWRKTYWRSACVISCRKTSRGPIHTYKDLKGRNMQLYFYCTIGWNIVVFDSKCNKRKNLCYLNLRLLKENRAIGLQKILWDGPSQISNSSNGECFLISRQLPERLCGQTASWLVCCIVTSARIVLLFCCNRFIDVYWICLLQL